MNNDLYAFADAKGITVIPFRLTNCESVSIVQNNNYYIGIDDAQLETSKEERVHLAHEIGHCETGTLYYAASPFSIREKAEYQADKWAIKKLIPKDEFINLLKKDTPIWELADYFNVTEEYIKKAYTLYMETELV